MIVVGLDVHKQSVTVVAVDEAGRPLAEKVIPVGSEELLGWASALDPKRFWAVEDCRQLTPWLERQAPRRHPQRAQLAATPIKHTRDRRASMHIQPNPATFSHNRRLP